MSRELTEQRVLEALGIAADFRYLTKDKSASGSNPQIEVGDVNRQN